MKRKIPADKGELRTDLLQESFLEGVSVLQQCLLEVDSLVFSHGVQDLEVFVLAAFLLGEELLLPVLQ